MARRGASELAVLTAAEQEASKIVSAARDERKSKMKSATAEAQREVDEYRAMREMKLRQSTPETDAMLERVRRVTAETDNKIRQLDAEYARTKDPVTAMLLQVVLNIDNPYAAK